MTAHRESIRIIEAELQAAGWTSRFHVWSHPGVAGPHGIVRAIEAQEKRQHEFVAIPAHLVEMVKLEASDPDDLTGNLRVRLAELHNHYGTQDARETRLKTACPTYADGYVVGFTGQPPAFLESAIRTQPSATGYADGRQAEKTLRPQEPPRIDPDKENAMTAQKLRIIEAKLQAAGWTEDWKTGQANEVKVWTHPGVDGMHHIRRAVTAQEKRQEEFGAIPHELVQMLELETADTCGTIEPGEFGSGRLDDLHLKYGYETDRTARFNAKAPTYADGYVIGIKDLPPAFLEAVAPTTKGAAGYCDGRQAGITLRHIEPQDIEAETQQIDRMQEDLKADNDRYDATEALRDAIKDSLSPQAVAAIYRELCTTVELPTDIRGEVLWFTTLLGSTIGLEALPGLLADLEL